MDHDPLTGQLLVASPSLFDPNFRRSVVLVVQHSDEGAIGIVLNQPSEATVGEVAPELAPLVEDDETVYVGGPVDDEAVVILAEFNDPAEAAAVVLGALFIRGALRLWRQATPQAARGLYLYSILYLFALFTAMAVDRVVAF
jgi:putative transcriptional regulator